MNNSGAIFLLQGSGDLVEMKESPYGTEDILQELVAKYPNLLAGEQMNAEAPRRWLLIRREMGVPDEQDGSNRWSLDHLFLDQDAIPTLIEVKRSSDTRIRREVVGQMLDYAANAVLHWPVETIRARFEQDCELRGTDAANAIETALGIVNFEEFWLRVKTNLEAGKIRMVFVADEIPPELKRIVEFLNGQMEFAEVLAVEIRQFVGQGLKTLVPRVIGQTVEAERRKSAGPREKRQWTAESFFEKLIQERGEAEASAARAIFDWAKLTKLRFSWGEGVNDGSFLPMIDHKGREQNTVAVWTSGTIETPFIHMKRRPPFDQEAKREELRNRLNQVPGVNLPANAVDRRPTIPISVITSSDALMKLIAVLDWIVQEVRGT